MKSMMKCMKLDLLLLKPYVNSILLVMLIPLLLTFFTGTFFEGLSFAATVMAMTTGYTFSVAEKNNLDRFYGFLPVKKKELVLGRYAAVCLTGFAALFLIMLGQTALLSIKGAAPSAVPALRTFLLCLTLFSVYAGVQMPGYYRFGSIKGKMFVFVPTVGYLLFYYVGRLLNADGRKHFQIPVPGNAALAAGAVCLILLILSASAAVSVKIYKRLNR